MGWVPGGVERLRVQGWRTRRGINGPDPGTWLYEYIGRERERDQSSGVPEQTMFSLLVVVGSPPEDGRRQGCQPPKATQSIKPSTVYVAVMVYHRRQRSSVYDAIIVYQNYDAVMVNHQQQAFYLL